MIRVVKYIVIVLVVIGIAFGANEFFNFFPKLKLKGLFHAKPQLLESPIVIKEIKKIGQLITAEFYGETFADLDDVYLSLVKKYSDTSEYVRINLAKKYPDFESFTKKAEKLMDMETKRDELKKQLLKIQSDYVKIQLDYLAIDSSSHKDLDKINKDVEDYLAQIDELKSSRKKERKLFGKEDKAKIAALDQSIDELSNKVEKSKSQIKAIKNSFEDEKDKYEKAKRDYSRSKDDIESQLASLETKTETTKRKLVYIGRGWVKAGYRLDSLNEKNIKIEQKGADTTILHLELDKPVIINADINPWFIEKELEGFEIFRNEKAGLDFTQEEVTAVKVKCRDKLIEDAIKTGLIQKAQQTGEQTIVRFFKLLGFSEVYISYKL